jgi:hypothetical protein
MTGLPGKLLKTKEEETHEGRNEGAPGDVDENKGS